MIYLSLTQLLHCFGINSPPAINGFVHYGFDLHNAMQHHFIGHGSNSAYILGSGTMWCGWRMCGMNNEKQSTDGAWHEIYVTWKTSSSFTIQRNLLSLANNDSRHTSRLSTFSLNTVNIISTSLLTSQVICFLTSTQPITSVTSPA